MEKTHPPYRQTYKNRKVQALEDGQPTQDPFQEETTMLQEAK